MTREEVVEIMNYCKEHKVTYKSRLEELNIPVWRFYDSKSRYAAEQSSGKTAQGEFIELPHSGSFVPVPSFAGTTGRKQKNTPATPSGLKEMEIRTPYIFINRDRIKLLHWEPGGMVQYSKLLEAGTLGKSDSASDNEVCANIEWRELVMIVEGIMEACDSRRTRLENLQKLRK